MPIIPNWDFIKHFKESEWEQLCNMARMIEMIVLSRSTIHNLHKKKLTQNRIKKTFL